MFRRNGVDFLVAMAIFALCLGVYSATLTPSLSYVSPDGNELATVCYTLGLAHSTGYPLYTWLGKLFTLLPIGDVAHRVNLMSATLGAAGVALLYVVLRLLTSELRHRAVSRAASAFAALLFGFSRTFWSQATIAEVYAPNVFMLALTLVLLLWWARVEERERRDRPAGQTGWRRFLPSPRSTLLLLAFGLCFGLSLGTHMSDLGFAPAFALFALLVSPWTAISPLGGGVAVGGFLLGLLQFLWLPLRAHTLLDAPMRAHAPTTLRGIYNYTLGAFPQFKFAFPLTALPDRVVVYLYFLVQQFGFVGLLLGIGGMWLLLFRRPRRFFLLVGMYLVHIWFFIQYRAFDLDVFFIPAHLIYALFIGYAVGWGVDRLAGLRWRAARWALVGLVGLALTLGLVKEVRANWAVNDRSTDTAINDFYENVFDLLPEGAVLLNRGGVFGYDLFHFRLVYGVRPDVLIPALEPGLSPEAASGREVYSVVPPAELGGRRNPWSPPSGWVSPEAWAVPVLIGNTVAQGSNRPLVLYRLTDEPPTLVVTDPRPEHRVEKQLGGLTLVGYDLEEEVVEAGGALHLTLYWRSEGPPGRLQVGTALGGTLLEVHPPGMGNLERYMETFHPPRGGVLVEDYRVVIPRLTEPGDLPLEVVVATGTGLEEPQAVERVVLQEITVLEPGAGR
ncbi:MAG TPA: DUF2723 domain-containing protein [Chloroflexi bacterium]|nr:DUF2723 domain-containing protein [Chloroflexota bacterium]